LIQGSDKTVMIDAVDPTMESVLMARLDDLAVKQIDYLVANHAEQDHSGSIPAVLARYPMAKVICTSRCEGLLKDLLLVPEDRIKTVADKETVSLGDRTLEFIHAAVPLHPGPGEKKSFRHSFQALRSAEPGCGSGGDGFKQGVGKTQP
jgi:flavorubredoxin